MSRVARAPKQLVTVAMRPLDLFEPMRELGRAPTSDDHTTPRYVVNVLDQFGRVGLDPCTNPTSHVRARTKVMLPDDGLAVAWADHGLVWCNFPYSDPLPWVKKGLVEADEIIFLTSTQTGTEWGARLMRGGSAACFLEKRVHFEIDGISQGSAQFSSLLVYRGSRNRRFRQTFEQLGKTVIL